MKFLVSFIPFLLLLVSSCSQNGSILSTKVEKDPGDLKILNEDSFMGATIAGTSFDHEIQVKAQGGLTLRDLNVIITTSDPIRFKGGSFPGIGGTCTSTLESGKSCSLIIEYSPQNTNSHIATLSFSYKDDIKDYGFNYQVSADSYPILIYDFGSEFNFGNKFVGSTTELRVKIKNRGRVVARNITINNLSLPFAFKGGNYPGTGGSCGTSISPEQDCEIYITYSPSAIGSHNQVVTLNYLNGGRNESNSLQLKGTGVFEAKLTLTAINGDDFGDTFNGINYDKTFTLTHSGGVKATNIQIAGLSTPYSLINGCGSTIESGSCSFTIRLNSSVSGTWNNNLIISYNTGTASETISKNITGITKKKAKITIEPKGDVNFGTVKTGLKGTQTFTVTYDEGDVPATLAGMQSLLLPFKYQGGNYPGGGTCGASISSGSCTFILDYAPTSFGSNILSTSFKYNDGYSDGFEAIKLIGKTQNELIISNTDLKNAVSGVKKIQDIQITSRWGGATVTDISFEVEAPFVLEAVTPTNPCGTQLLQNSTCYRRIGVISNDSGQITKKFCVNYHNGVEKIKSCVDVKVNITSVADLEVVDASPINFGDVSQNSLTGKTILLRNNSTMEATNVQFVQPYPTGFRPRFNTLSGTNCRTTISSGVCSIELEFHPRSVGSFNGILNLKYFNGVEDKILPISLSGGAITTNNLFLVPETNVEFGTVNIGNSVASEKRFTLFHGGGPVTRIVSSKTFSSPQDFQLSIDQCPVGKELVNGSSCALTVTFVPSTVSARSTNLTITDSSAGLSVTSTLSGIGQGAILNASVNSIDFGNRSTDTYYDQVITLTNVGNQDAHSFSNFSSGNLSLINYNCSRIPKNGSCQIIARFTPTSDQTYNTNRSFTYSNTYNVVTKSFSLKGTGLKTAILSFNPSSIDFGEVIRTQNDTREIYIVNSGQTKATGLSPTTLSLPFSFLGGSYPGTGGTCGDELDSGSCKIVVSFSPSETGLKNTDLGLSYNNGNVERNITPLSIKGRGITQAILTISETNPFNMGTTIVNNTIYKEFTIRNVGDFKAVITGSSFLPLDQTTFTYKNNSFPGSETVGKCILNADLPSGASCFITIAFKPREAKSSSVFFQLNYQDGLENQVENKVLTGTGSNTLRTAQYLSLFEESPYLSSDLEEISLSDINKNNTEDFLLRSTTYLKTIDGWDDSQIFLQRYQIDGQFLEGLQTLNLLEDRNKDGTNDLLLSLHQKNHFTLTLVGYVIRCAQTGNIIETFNKHTQAQGPRDSF